MATYVEGGRGLANEAEPFGLLSEGVAGIAAIVLAVIALAGTADNVLVPVVAIVIGVGLLVQAFNAGAEGAKMTSVGPAASAQAAEYSGEVTVDILAGITGIILGILALVGIHSPYLVAAALIVFGAALLLGGALSMGPRTAPVATATGPGTVQIVSHQRSAAAGGMELMIGVAAIVLGILSLIFMTSWVLTLVGFIAIGAAMLMVSASFSGAVMRLFTA